MLCYVIDKVTFSKRFQNAHKFPPKKCVNDVR